jgi:hypothetical protein
MQQQDKDHAPAERKTRHDEKRLAGERGEARRRLVSLPNNKVRKGSMVWFFRLDIL